MPLSMTFEWSIGLISILALAALTYAIVASARRAPRDSSQQDVGVPTGSRTGGAHSLATGPGGAHGSQGAEQAGGPATAGRALANAPRAVAPLRPSLTNIATDREFLPAALEILETPPSPVATTLMMTICALAVAALTWATLGHLDIYAEVPGKIQPSGRTKIVQPLEPGRVSAIHVTSGAVVRADDILVELDSTEVVAELEALTRERESAMAESARRALSGEIAKSGRLLPQAITFDESVGLRVREREQVILNAEIDHLRSAVEGFKTELDERRATQARLKGSIAARSAQIKLAEERVGMKEEVTSRGAGSRAIIIDAQMQYEGLITTNANDKGQLIEVGAAMVTLEKKIERALIQFIAEQAQKGGEIDRRRDRLDQEIVKAKARFERTRLKSPIDGSVQLLDVHSLGQVVASGQAILAVVPNDGPLEIEATIANKDIGFVKVGQEATIKIEAFPFTRYGTLKAEVIRVSTDAVDEGSATGMTDAATAARPQNGTTNRRGSQGQTLVFPATLKLDQRSILVEGKKIALTPGMTVTAEIKTGQRRAISYVLSPLTEILSSSAGER